MKTDAIAQASGSRLSGEQSGQTATRPGTRLALPSEVQELHFQIANALRIPRIGYADLLPEVLFFVLIQRARRAT
jgi:hypothetical protein